MKPIKSLLILLAILAVHNSIAQTGDASEKTACIPCEELMNIRIPDVTISRAEQVQVPAPHCKVTGVIGREINFELLLPEKWNARFVMGGGGGFVGSVQNVAQSSVAHGYATSGTDTGHKGNGLKADWALNHMERQVNFGHLAVHRTAVTSKEIIRQYYCTGIAYSYFVGCSRGGGQALMEAQRYPDDFDGIVAGAPAFNWPAIGAEFIRNSQAIYPDPDDLNHPVITQSNLELLQSLVLEQCDAMDGVKDQILNDPVECVLDYDAFPRCIDDTPSDNCFTTEQLEAIKQVYSGVSVDHVEIYPGFPPGGENEPGGWQAWITGPNAGSMLLGFPSLHFGFGTEMFKYLVFQDPAWDYSTYDFSDFLNATQYASSYLDATSTDYSEFKNSGGKMIIYHGWADPALSAYATIDHYEQVMRRDPGTENYIRLFLLPGVLHCGGGPGPDQADWIELIRSWVEQEIAPDRVILSKSEAGKAVLTRPVFPYPGKAVYKGTGDPNDEENFRASTGNK
jgi:hypothetical protein